MRIVNYVFRARLPMGDSHLSLEKIAANIPNAKFYPLKPCQVLVRICPGAVCLIFSKGGLRLMGSKVTSKRDAKRTLLGITTHFTKLVPRQVKLQTMTVITTMPGPVNLYTFHKQIQSQYEFELFSALKITAFGRVCANLFSSGKVVLTGCRSLTQAKDIIETLHKCYCKDNNHVHS
jgi:TATA-box binding protein (TBP) (component of TFIID and TFIIIB)